MADMKLRQSSKLVQVNDNNYRVRKMPPWTATYLVKFVAAKLLPMLGVLDDAKKAPAVNNVLADTPQVKAQQKQAQQNRDRMMETLSNQLPKILDDITEEELKDLMIKSLQYCDAMYLPAGPQPIMSKHGNFGVQDIEYDFPLLIQLIIEVIKFNTEGFFGEGGFNIARLTETLSHSKQ